MAVIDAARALFIHNMDDFEDGETDAEAVQAAWLLDEELQAFWVAQVEVVVQALGAP